MYSIRTRGYETGPCQILLGYIGIMCLLPPPLFLKYHSITIGILRYRRVSGIGNMSRPSINVLVFEYGCLEQETINILFQGGTSGSHGDIWGLFPITSFPPSETSDYRSATRWKILCNCGMWELPQVVAEALKSSTTPWLDLHDNDIGDEGAEAPLLDWLRFCGGVVWVGVWEIPEWRIFRVRIWNCSTHKGCCREIVVFNGADKVIFPPT